MSQSIESSTTAIAIEYVFIFISNGHLKEFILVVNQITKQGDMIVSFGGFSGLLAIWVHLNSTDIASGPQLVRMHSRTRVSWSYPDLQRPLRSSRI